MIKGRKIIELNTERLILRPVKVEDASDAYNNWCSDDSVSKYMRWSTHKNVNETIEWLTEERKNIENKEGEYTFGIVIKETDELIGTIGVYLRLEEENRYEIGYGISKKYWNQGYTSEALKCLMEYLINDVKLTKFICRHATENPASGSVMQKVGFRYVKDSEYVSFDGKKRYKSKEYHLDINN